MIQLGDTGPLVRCWQRIVGATADGNFGPGTDGKVKAWQTAHGIEPDGVLGLVSRAALKPGDLIKPYEGLRLYTYDDHDSRPLTLGPGNVWRRPDGAAVMGYPTIGWGRRLFPGEYITHCSKAEADQWFDDALKGTFLPAVNRTVDDDPAKRCAAASFAYNCGTGALNRLAAAKFGKAVWLDFMRTKGVPNAGLAMRRAEEQALYASADEGVAV